MWRSRVDGRYAGEGLMEDELAVAADGENGRAHLLRMLSLAERLMRNVSDGPEAVCLEELDFAM